MVTYNDLVIATRNALRAQGIEGCALEARLIVSVSAGKTMPQLMRDGNLYTTAAVQSKVRELTERRLKGEPVAYITGEWEFYGLPMKVTPDVLIPRMDTEVLIDAAKEILVGRKMDARILDLCCGSGCISCAIGHELPASRLVAVDISAKALEVCRSNLALNLIAPRAITLQADALSFPPLSLGKAQFDMILCNPPYIATSELAALDASVKDYEPRWALDGGEDGLKFYRSVIKYWRSLLRSGGAILFEVGEGQAAEVAELLDSAVFHDISTRKDTLGVERVVIGFN